MVPSLKNCCFKGREHLVEITAEQDQVLLKKHLRNKLLLKMLLVKLKLRLFLNIVLLFWLLLIKLMMFNSKQYSKTLNSLFSSCLITLINKRENRLKGSRNLLVQEIVGEKSLYLNKEKIKVNLRMFEQQKMIKLWCFLTYK